MSDPLLVVATVFPLALAGVGVALIWWAAHTRFPADVEADVLAALSEGEALPVRAICTRAQLRDPVTVESALEHLRQRGRIVRWYARDAEASTAEEPVYRRIAA